MREILPEDMSGVLLRRPSPLIVLDVVVQS
jgi:hypothetical protein